MVLLCKCSAKFRRCSATIQGCPRQLSGLTEPSLQVVARPSHDADPSPPRDETVEQIVLEDSDSSPASGYCSFCVSSGCKFTTTLLAQEKVVGYPCDEPTSGKVPQLNVCKPLNDWTHTYPHTRVPTHHQHGEEANRECPRRTKLFRMPCFCRPCTRVPKLAAERTCALTNTTWHGTPDSKLNPQSIVPFFSRTTLTISWSWLAAVCGAQNCVS